jgi:tetratricopeptide (TPR) repeat protein
MHRSALHIFLAITLLFPAFVSAQRKEQQRVDSLQVLLSKHTTKDDTVKAGLLHSLAFAYFAVDPDKGIQYAQQAFSLSEKLQWKKGIARSVTALGANNWAKNNYEEAIAYYRKAIKYNEAEHDTIAIATNFNNIGGAYHAQYKFMKAIEYFNQSIALYHLMGDKLKEQGVHQNIAESHQSLQNYRASIEDYKRALALNQAIQNKRNVASVLSRMGVMNARVGDYAIALENEQQALTTFRELNEKDDIASTLGNIGHIYYLRKEHNLSLDYYKRAIAMTEELNNKFAKEYLAIYYGYAGKNYLQLSLQKSPADTLLLGKAISNLQSMRTISIPIKDWVQLKEFLPDLSKAYSLQGNNKKALDIYKEYSAYTDSLYNTEKDKEITRHEVEYEYSKQQDSMRYAYNLQQSRLNALSKEKEVNELRFKQQWLYTIVGIIVILLFGLYLFFRARIKNLNLKNELASEKAQKELKEAEYKNRLNDITYAALQAQMNPHFIFNCLNSIKLYAEQNNTQAASVYLTKFSRLIRMILDHSRANTIVLTSELELLELYLEMEAMRFKTKLRYSIEVDDEVESDFIEIPPMLIQPYVENAIWHGLMHKPEGGMIQIHITHDIHAAMLIISITDDGIGRKRAAELKSRTSTQYASHGTRVTAERIELLNEKYKSGAEVTVEDLETEDMEPAGTKVIIKLPVK